MANDVRGELARRIAEVAPGDLHQGVLHQRRRRRERVRRPHGPPRHRPPQGALDVPHATTAAPSTAISLTGDPRRWANEPGDASVAHFFGPYLYRSAFHATTPQEETQRALEHLENVIVLEGAADDRRDHHRDGRRHQRRARSAARLPRRRARAVRQVRHRLHRRRGHGRLRPDRRMVRGRRVRRRPRPDHLRQGRQLRLRAARRRRHLRPHRRVLRRRVRSRAASPTPAIRSPARPASRRSRCSSATASSERVRDLGARVVEPEIARLARHATRRSARCAAAGCSGRSSWCAIARDARAARPVQRGRRRCRARWREVAAACKAAGVWPFTHFNRMHIAPPLVISEEELRARPRRDRRRPSRSPTVSRSSPARPLRERQFRGQHGLGSILVRDRRQETPDRRRADRRVHGCCRRRPRTPVVLRPRDRDARRPGTPSSLTRTPPARSARARARAVWISSVPSYVRTDSRFAEVAHHRELARDSVAAEDAARLARDRAAPRAHC